MKKNKSPEQDLQKSKIILFILLLLFALVAVLVAVEKMLLSNTENSPGANLLPENLTITEDMTAEEVNEISTEVEQLAETSEATRMQYYINKFIGYIENQEYDKAYSVLYPDFKTNYFPTLDEFTTYAQKKYSDFVTINYEDMQRQGNIYIFFVTIQDLSDSTNNEKNFSQKFIVQEKQINNFVLSFEVVE